MSMSRKKCCVPGCMDSGNSSQTLHLFPNPVKYRARFNQWVTAIGGDIIGLDNEDIYKRRSVCHAHFEEKYCCRYNRLSNIAVPTINLPGPLVVPRFTFAERRPLREIQNCLMPVLSTAVSSEIPSTSGFSADPIITLPAVAENAPLKIDKGYPTKKTAARIRQTRVTPEEQRLRQQLIKMRIKLSKCRSTVKKQSASIKAAKNITTNPALLTTLEKMPSTTKLLTMMQFRELRKRNKGRRFSLQEKILALSIFKRTPKGYRFLRKMLILPAPQTLAKLLTQANVEPGINTKVFHQLKKVAEKMKTEERLCVLLFDEMFLKANVSFNERRDKIIGFVTDGKETKPNFADHAQVYMVRGLLKNYKQSVCYTFSASATSGQQIAIQIKEVVTELQKAGLIIVATICDQGANNRLALKLLEQESRGTYLKKGEEPKDNVILINNEEVIPLYDPPHLLKCIRNNLITKNLEYFETNIKCTAKWEHLILLYKENPGYKGVRLIPKLTENHVLPEKLLRNKMKVKFATQIFSRTVAANMGYLSDKGILPKECSQTADLLVFFDNLFDSSNGSYNKKDARYAKPLLGPVTPKSQHHKEWAEAKKKLKCMKFVHPISGKVENVPTLNNWAWTLDGYEVLFKKLEKDYNVTSVWMRHLNQDPLENFFGLIRSHGCRNTNPTPEKFEGAFTTLLINNMSSAHAPTGANCEEDFAKTLYTLIVTDNCKATTACNINYCTEIIIEDVKTKLDPRIIGALQYVSGYFIRNAKKKVFKNCKNCNKSTVATEGTDYIKYREYAGRQWLCSPTESVINSISAVQDITYTLIKEYFDKNYLKELIKTYVIMFVNFDYLECEEHKEKIIEYLINIALRFFIYNYCKDINKILNGKMDCHDDEDRFKVKAKKYYKKCCKRPFKK